MLSEYIVNAIFEHEYNALREELSICLDALARAETEEGEQDAKQIIDKLLFATNIIERMHKEIKKL